MGFFCRFLLPRSSEQFSQRHGEIWELKQSCFRSLSIRIPRLWDCSLKIVNRAAGARHTSAWYPTRPDPFLTFGLHHFNFKRWANSRQMPKWVPSQEMPKDPKAICFFIFLPDSAGYGVVALLALLFDVMQRLSATILFQRAATLFRALQLSTER